MSGYITVTVSQGTIYYNSRVMQKNDRVRALARASQLPGPHDPVAVRLACFLMESNPAGAMRIRECSRLASYNPFLLVWWPTAPDDLKQIKWNELDDESRFILRHNKPSAIPKKYKLVKVEVPGYPAFYRLARVKL